MTLEEEVAQLRAENQALRESLRRTQELLRVALVRNEELEKLKTPPPDFVKANKKKPQEEEKKARKKRDAKHNWARPRSAPTQVMEHRLITCLACHLRLGGISLSSVREVIDLPPPAPMEVTHHRIYKGWCAGCQTWHEAPVDLHEQVLGSATQQPDCHLAHHDASSHPTDPVLPAYAARSHDQEWRDCGAHASDQSPDAAPDQGSHDRDPRQPSGASR